MNHITTQAGGPEAPVESSAAPTVAPAVAPDSSRWVVPPPSESLALLAVVAVLGWSYASNIASLVRIWNREPDYSHGWLVLPLSLFILWQRWPKQEDEVEIRPSVWGWVVVALSLVARAFFYERNARWSETATLLPVIFGLGLARLGVPMMRRLWPGFAFLLFLLPLPNALNSALSQPLQRLGTVCACFVLKLSGLWVMPEGNVILVGSDKLEVAAACNGLSMLMSLAATVAAAASVFPMASYKRFVLLLSIVPIALASNVLRIAATAWCYHQFGAEVGSKYAHDAAGYLMMPVAIALVLLELSVLSWLIVETEDDRHGLTALERVSGRGALVEERP